MNVDAELLARIRQAITDAEHEREIHFANFNDTAANYQDGWADALTWVLRQLGADPVKP